MTLYILLCTHQGDEFLRQQLESIAAQSVANWEVWASDDGSIDSTLSILETYRREWGKGKMHLHLGPNRGFVVNFLSLTRSFHEGTGYYAFADQDDIWHRDKLQRAVAWLESVPADCPALYCSRSRLINESGEVIGLSPLFTRAPCFANALVQNIASGNTMVFNEAARSLLAGAGEDVDVPVHDWWLYLVVTGCGGRVHYDREPTLDYRQHGENQLSASARPGARLRLMYRQFVQGRYRAWNGRNIAALQRLHARLTPENRTILAHFVKARQADLFRRLPELRRSGVYRQTPLEDWGLRLAALLGKI